MMKVLRLDEWQGALALEFQEQTASATTIQIGKQLQFKLAKITAEPLAGELRLLLGELEAKTSRKDDSSLVSEREADSAAWKENSR
jgi:hypothetical protein